MAGSLAMACPPAQDYLKLTGEAGAAATKSRSSKGMAIGSNGQKAQHSNPRCPFHKVHPAHLKDRRRTVRRARRVSDSEGHQVWAGLFYADLRPTGEEHRKERGVRT